MRLKQLTWVIFIAACLDLTPTVSGQGYTYSIVVTQGQSIDGYTLYDFRDPKITNDGLVVFWAWDSPTASGVEGLYTPTRKVVRRGDTIAGRTLQSINYNLAGIDYLDLNNAGQIIFSGDPPAQRGLYWVDARNPAVAAFVPGSAIAVNPASLGFWSLSDLGVSGGPLAGAFLSAATAASGSQRPIFFTSPATPPPGRLLFFPGGTFAGLTNVNPFFDGAGSRNGVHVAFRASTASGTQLLKLSGSAQRRLAGTGDVFGGKTLTLPLNGSARAQAINNTGEVVFTGFYPTASSEGWLLLRADANGVVSVVADTASPYLGRTLGFITAGAPAIQGPVINNAGQVAFLGLANSYAGVFTQTAVVAEPNQLILPGKILSSPGWPAMNDKGQIAFTARVNLVPSVVVATPAPNCGADLSSQLIIQRGGFRYNYATGRFEQVVRVTNAGAGLTGNLLFVLENLSTGVGLAGATGTSSCGAGGPMTSLGVAGLAPNASVNLTLEFSNPAQTPIQYGLRVYGQN